MKYMDLTGTEIERLYQFHLQHPDAVLRVNHDTAIADGTIEKIVTILGTSETADIADKDI